MKNLIFVGVLSAFAFSDATTAQAATLDVRDYGLTSFSYSRDLTGSTKLIDVNNVGFVSDDWINFAIAVLSGLFKPKQPGHVLPAAFSLSITETPSKFNMVMAGSSLPVANSGLNEWSGSFNGAWWQLPLFTLRMQRPNNAFRDLVTIGGSGLHKIDPDDPGAGPSDLARYSVSFFTARDASDLAERTDTDRSEHGNGHYEDWLAEIGGTTGRDVVFDRNRIVEFSFSLSATHVPLPSGLPLMLAGLGAFLALRAKRGRLARSDRSA